MSNRIYIPPRLDPRLPIVPKSGLIRPLMANGSGGGGPGFAQNRVASAGAYLSNGTNDGWSASELTISLWFTPPEVVFGTPQIWGSGTVGTAPRTRVDYDNGRVKWFAQPTTQMKNVDWDTSLPGMGYLHFLLSSNGNADSSELYINDVQQVKSGNDGAGFFWSGILSPRTLLASVSGASPVLSPEQTDLWVNNGYFDLTVESNRRKFISASGQPVDLGTDGELPTGGSPSVYYGNTMLAEDWNIQNGGRGTDTSWQNNSGDFTDVGVRGKKLP